MNTKNIGLAAAAAAGAVVMIAGGSAITTSGTAGTAVAAQVAPAAAPIGSSSTSTTAPATSAPTSGAPSAPSGSVEQNGPCQHTPVTGDELAKVTAAIKAKDSAVTVTSVRKDADGSYDAFGTKAGAPARVEVSKDLKSVTVEAGGGGRHGGGKGDGGRGGNHTPVTGEELTKVTAAVKARDAAVTVTRVRQDADGSYDAFGTKSGAPVRVEVSKDLKTVTVQAAAEHGGHR